MHILIEMPRSLLLETYAVHGANKIVSALFRCLVQADDENRFTVVTDLSVPECESFNNKHGHNGRCYYVTYLHLFDIYKHVYLFTFV